MAASAALADILADAAESAAAGLRGAKRHDARALN